MTQFCRPAIALVGLLSCIALAEQPQARPATQPALAATYRAQFGDPKEGGFYSIMVMDLKPDGTLSLTNTMPDLQKPGEQIKNLALGTWAATGDSVTLTMTTHNGRPIPADDPKRVLKFEVKDSGKELAGPGGPALIRQ